jgi:hypothetical protein
MNNIMDSPISQAKESAVTDQIPNKLKVKIILYLKNLDKEMI